MRRDPGADMARAVSFNMAIAERCADRVVPFRWGRALFTTEVPDTWDRNFLLVEDPDEEMTAQALAQEADRVMGVDGYKHRKILVNDETLGRALAAGFTELGWGVTELLWMAHRRDPARVPEAPVDELAEAVHERAMDEFNRRNPDIADDDIVRQMRDAARAVGQATDKRCFGAYVGDTVAAVCELYSDGLTAQIEDVGTLQEHRGRGLATALVLRALHEAQSWGHDLIFLCADDDDWPKELYAKLGFDLMGRTYDFLLKPAGPRQDSE